MRLVVVVAAAILCSSPSLATRQEFVLVLDQTLCWNCSDPQGETDPT